MLYSLRIVNSSFNSNTYIIYLDGDNSAWLVDCGDYSVVSKWLLRHNKILKGIFITQGHFDHIYGINEAIKEFPSMQIFLSSFGGIKIIGDEKLNGSIYAEIPFKVVNGNFIEVSDGADITIFNSIYVKIFVVKGHSEDSLAFLLSPIFLLVMHLYLIRRRCIN